MPRPTMADVASRMARFRTKGGSVSAAGRQEAESKGETMPGGSFPIRNASDLANAKQSVGRAKNPEAARRWINKRAKDLGKPGLGEGSKRKMPYTHARGR